MLFGKLAWVELPPRFIFQFLAFNTYGAAHQHVRDFFYELEYKIHSRIPHSTAFNAMNFLSYATQRLFILDNIGTAEIIKHEWLLALTALASLLPTLNSFFGGHWFTKKGRKKRKKKKGRKKKKKKRKRILRTNLGILAGQTIWNETLINEIKDEGIKKSYSLQRIQVPVIHFPLAFLRAASDVYQAFERPPNSEKAKKKTHNVN
jgi:hypothetical protein